MDQTELIEKITKDVMEGLTAELGQQDKPRGISGGTETIGSKIRASEMVTYIDHTLLKPDAPQEAFDKLCQEALQYGFKSVCVNSGRVPYVSRKLQGTHVLVCSVVGFPL